MTVTQEERRRSFNQIAETYAAMRPGYPRALIDDVITLSRMPAGGRILEIGCGPATASVSFAARGYSMVCLEMGDRLAGIARERLAQWPDVEVRVTRFEDWQLEPGAFDLVLAASSFHWVEEDIAYTKSAAALRGGGSLAILRNTATRAKDSDMQSALDEIYGQWLPRRAGGPKDPTLGNDDPQTLAMRSSGFFEEVVVCHYPWDTEFDTESYIRLLETYSDHQTLPMVTKEKLYAQIRKLILSRGGMIARHYDSRLYLGRKKS